MRRRTTRIALVLLALLAAGTGGSFAIEAAAERASRVDLVTVSVGSLGRDGRARAARLPLRADMLGASWRGDADAIELRARGSDGRWSRWVELHATADAPDPSGREARSAARRLGARRAASAPVWVGDAEQVQVRPHDGELARDVRVAAINATGTSTRRERAAGTLHRGAAWVLGEATPSAEAVPYAPGIRKRARWGAAPPRSTNAMALDTGVVGAVVHHTAGTNRYSCAQVPALLRGIQRYHMQSNGWNDIGYNFLVDRCGGVWEGRDGGVTRPVIGAHTAGFNTSTTGIALIGTHTVARPTTRAQIALQRLLAWRMDVAHVKPTGKMVLTARSGDRYATGSRVLARAISGHRDLYPTSCPGAMTYSDLRRIAWAAWRIGGAKVANITRRHTLANPGDPLDPAMAAATVRAVGSSRDMLLAVRIEQVSTGTVLKVARTRGSVITTTWTAPEGVRVPWWDVRVVVNGTAGTQRARRAVVPLAWTPPDPAFVVTSPPQSTVAPGGDPSDDRVRLEYTLGQQYQLGAWLHDPATGAQVATLQAPGYVGTSSTPVPLELAIPRHVQAGSYELRVGLPGDTATGRSMQRFALAVSRG